MHRLARLSLANRALIALVSLAIIGFGALAARSLNQELIPSLQLPGAIITTTYPGASPEIVSREVTEPVESAIKGVDGLSKTASTSSNGRSVVQAELSYGTDIDNAVQKIQQAVNRVSDQLPDAADPSVFAGSVDDFPVVLLAASTGGDERRTAQRLRDVVVPELESLSGVREAQVTGVQQEQVSVRLDEDELADHGLTVASVIAALRSNGVSVPGGDLTEKGRTLSVDVGGPFTSAEDLENLYLLPTASPGPPAQSSPGGTRTDAGAAGEPGAAAAAGPAGGAEASGAAPGARPPAAPEPVRLGDVAEVSTGLAGSTTITRTDGRPTLGVSVIKTADASTVAVSDAVKEEIPRLRDALGGAATLTVVFDQAPFIEDSIDGLTTEGLVGLGFAVLVILVFLLSIRSTLVTAVSIPFSLLVALIGLYAGGYSLNILTLGALAVAVGRVVDDSIVVLENIKRHLGYGEEKQQAILTAVKEVGGAVTASTVTTVAVFLPIAFVGGQAGELFRPFGVTVAIALLASLFVSLTIIPVLAYWFLRPARAGAADPERVRHEALAKERRNPLQRVYVPIISWVTRRKAVTIVAGVAVFAGTVALVPLLRTDFLGSSGQNTMTISQELPAGTSLERTDAAARQVEGVLRGMDGIESYQVTVGSGGFGGFGGGSRNEASFSVTTKADADQAALADRLRERLDATAGAGELHLDASGGSPAGSGSLEVIVRAPNEAVLRDAAGMVERTVEDTPGTVDVANNLASDAPGVQVSVDAKKAAVLGLSESQIGQAVRQAFEGQQVGTAVLAGEQRDVVVRVGDEPGTVGELRDLELATPTGRTVALDDVADIARVERPVQLTRIDGARSASITAAPSDDDLGALTNRLQQRLDGLKLPQGASYELGGVSADQREAFTQLGLAMLAAIVIVFLVMVATFRSLAQPLVLLVSVPFAATGAIGLSLATDTALGVPSLIGLLMLVGIVVTNAIVLIDLMNQYQAQGRPVREAVVEGARQRLRPILMTAVATICALVPMSLGLTGGGVFISKPLAIVVIGGLISSTVLTLVLVPTLYTIVEERKERRRQRALRRVRAVPARGGGGPPQGGSDEQGGGGPSHGESEGHSGGGGSRQGGRRERAPSENGHVPAARAPQMPSERREGHIVHGSVLGPDDRPMPGAALTLTDLSGHQVDRAQAGPEGHYQLMAPTGGTYLLIAAAGRCRPDATLVNLTERSAEQHVVLDGPEARHSAVRPGP